MSKPSNPATMLARFLGLNPLHILEQEMCFCSFDDEVSAEYARNPTAWLSKVSWGEVYEFMATTTKP